MKNFTLTLKDLEFLNPEGAYFQHYCKYLYIFKNLKTGFERYHYHIRPSHYVQAL
jgi:hypothetical protein